MKGKPSLPTYGLQCDPCGLVYDDVRNTVKPWKNGMDTTIKYRALSGCGIIDRYKNKYAHDNPIEEAAEELISKSLSDGQKIDFTPDSPDPDSPEP